MLFQWNCPDGIVDNHTRLHGNSFTLERKIVIESPFK